MKTYFEAIEEIHKQIDLDTWEDGDSDIFIFNNCAIIVYYEDGELVYETIPATQISSLNTDKKSKKSKLLN